MGGFRQAGLAGFASQNVWKASESEKSDFQK